MPAQTWASGDALNTANLNTRSPSGFLSKTISAAAYAKGTSGVTANDNAVAVNAAVTDAGLLNMLYVMVPASHLPYNASLVTFNNAVKMIREGGEPRVHDPQAYGAAGNAVFVSPASIGGRATITGQDDTIALQACIDAAAANLEVVLLPPNNFKITSALKLPTNTQLFGSGWNSAIYPDWFDGTGGASGGEGALINTNNLNTGNSNIRVQDLYIRGAGPGTPTGSGLANGACASLFFRGISAPCLDIVITGLKITNSVGISISYQGCQRIRITNNLIHDVGKDGITGSWATSTANMTEVLVEGNTIFNAGDDDIAVLGHIAGSFNSTARPSRITICNNICRDTLASNYVGRGIIVFGCENFAVTGNIVQNTFSSGIMITYDTSGGSKFSSRYGTVTGNTIIDAGQQGNGTQDQSAILVSGAQAIQISGNVIQHAKSNGILVTDDGTVAGAVRDINIVGNTIANCGSIAVTDEGIRVKCTLVGGTQRTVIAANTITASWCGGIAVEAADQTIIDGNYCTNNGQNNTQSGREAGIFITTNGLQVATAVVRNNVCTDTQGSPTQATGFDIGLSGTLWTRVVCQDNYFRGNALGAPNAEVVVNSMPTVFEFRRDDQTQVLASGVTPTVDSLMGENCTLTITSNIAVVIQNPTRATTGRTSHILRFAIRNGSGGALTTPPNFGTNFLLNGAVGNPGNGTQMMYTFDFDPVQAKYYEIGSHAAAM